MIDPIKESNRSHREGEMWCVIHCIEVANYRIVEYIESCTRAEVQYNAIMKLLEN